MIPTRPVRVDGPEIDPNLCIINISIENNHIRLICKIPSLLASTQARLHSQQSYKTDACRGVHGRGQMQE